MDVAARTPISLSLPWKTRFLLWVFSIAVDLALRRDGTVNRRLIKLLDFRISTTSKSINGVKTYDVVVDPSRNLWFRVFVPTQHALENLPVMVFFHGGGYILMAPDMKMYDDVCRKFARGVQAIVVSVDYRLAPEHRHPAQHNDAFDVLNYLDNEENRSKWLPRNANISRCFLAGDSAGGNIAHHVAQRACQFNFQKLKVIGLMAIQPFFGGEERTNSEIQLQGTPFLSLNKTDWFWNAFMPQSEGYNRDHPIINVSGPKAVDIAKIDFPTTMVVMAGFDILRDRQKSYHEWLIKSGKKAYLVDYKNMFHTFYLFPELPESDKLILEMKDFIQKTILNIKRRV